MRAKGKSRPRVQTSVIMSSSCRKPQARLRLQNLLPVVEAADVDLPTEVPSDRGLDGHQVSRFVQANKHIEQTVNKESRWTTISRTTSGRFLKLPCPGAQRSAKCCAAEPGTRFLGSQAGSRVSLRSPGTQDRRPTPRLSGGGLGACRTKTRARPVSWRAA